jgi:hypothetical protein
MSLPGGWPCKLLIRNEIAFLFPGFIYEIICNNFISGFCSVLRYHSDFFPV